MRILFVGVYRDHTGWGQAATDLIVALDSVGADVICRPLRLNNNVGSVSTRIKELEDKPSSGADTVIQHVLPHLFDYNGRLHNIGMYASETDSFRNSTWAERLNDMDEAWVINKQMIGAARRSGVKVNLTVIPHALDMTRFQRSYKPLDQLQSLRDKEDFTFYTIGEAIRRKNFAALLKAWHLEFDVDEPVRLVIKSSLPGASSQETRQHLDKLNDEIWRGLKLPGSRKDPIVLTDRLTDEGIMRLHSSCDCFIAPSYGEAWCQPAMDAMAMGKTPIATGCTGFLDYLDDKVGWLVECHPEPVFGAIEGFGDLFVGQELWSAIDVGHLRRCMRAAFEADSTQREEKAQQGIERAYDFSYRVVGQKMLDALTHPRGANVELSQEILQTERSQP